MLATALAVCASIQDDSIHVSGSGASLEFPVSASVDGNGIEGQFLGVSGHANSGGVGYNVELPVFGSVMGAAASPDGVEGHLKGVVCWRQRRVGQRDGLLRERRTGRRAQRRSCVT